MTDLSKIDFSRLTLPEWSGDRVVCKWSHTAGSLLVKRNGFDFASLSPGRPWVYDRGPWSLLEVAKTYTDRVDAFIVAETARLAAEDEAANWVAVPWQDVEWLVGAKAKVQWRGQREWSTEVKWNDCARGAVGYPDPSSYRADRRTLPAGYDPEKPRWVEVLSSQVQRLKDAGCAVAYHDDDTHDWARLSFITGCFGPLSRYAIDVHTLQPGVPLHEKPPSGIIAGLRWTAARARTEISSWPQWQQDAVKAAHDQAVTSQPPKPEPRPCTREFALRHPDESEWRVRQYDGDRFSWSTWRPMSRVPLFQASVNDHEFRTTARETQTVAQLSVSMYIRPYADASDLLRKLGSLPCGCYKITATRIA